MCHCFRWASNFLEIFYIFDYFYSLVRLHTNVNNSLDRLEKFIFTEWKFDNKKTLELQKTLNKTDREKFNIDIGTLDWESYFIDLTQGVRRYLNNEGVKTLEAARGKDTL